MRLTDASASTCSAFCASRGLIDIRDYVPTNVGGRILVRSGTYCNCCYEIKDFGGSQCIGALFNVISNSRNTVRPPKDEIYAEKRLAYL